MRILLFLVLLLAGSNAQAAGLTGPVGPQANITCPAGAVNIPAGTTSAQIQNIVNNNANNTTFCFRAGIFPMTSSVRPKTNNTFVGEFGAILDGTGWTTTDLEAGAFRAHNEDIDYVTIRNLVIRNMPRKGIQAYYHMSDHWTVEYNEIANCFTGIEFGQYFTIRNNYIHDNVSSTPHSGIAAERGGGYAASHADGTVFESNEIARNGQEQKVLLSSNVTFRSNFVHHSVGDGIWLDSNYTAPFLIEDNLVEDNGRIGIDVEATTGATVRNNVIRRSGGDAIFIFRTQSTEIYNNTMEHNFRAIEYYIICGDVLPGEDLQNVSSHDNIIVVGTEPDAYANGNVYSPGNCNSTQLAAYMNGSKNLTFSNNRYYVPDVSVKYWLWQTMQSWSQWQAIPQDATGTVRPLSEYVPSAASACDLNDDGRTNEIDVQLGADQAIGALTCTGADINRDGKCDVVDVQRLVNAALGSTCVSP